MKSRVRLPGDIISRLRLHQSVCLSVSLYLDLSLTRLPVSLSLDLSLTMCVVLPVWLSLCSSVCLSLCLSLFLSLSLSHSHKHIRTHTYENQKCKHVQSPSDNRIERMTLPPSWCYPNWCTWVPCEPSWCKTFFEQHLSQVVPRPLARMEMRWWLTTPPQRRLSMCTSSW